MQKKQPNILIITSDQHRGDCYGFEGRKVRTPHLDEMASMGTRFNACITPNVVCQPSRASILTGLLPRTHGVHDNGIDLNPAIGEKGFAGALAAAGYNTSFIGKAHFATYHTFQPTGTPECTTTTRSMSENWNGPYMGFQHVELMMTGHNYFLPNKPPEGQHYERFFHANGMGERRIEQYHTKLPPISTAAQTFNSALPEAFHNTTWVADRTIDYIKDAAKSDQPFCMWASIPDPHHPFDAPAPWCYMHHPDEVDIPEHRTRDFDKRPWWHRASVETDPKGGTAESRRVRREFSRIDPQTDQQLREMTANYYGMISLIDHNVGRILLSLQESGLEEDTIVIFTTDHGDLMGDHGLYLKGPAHYEGLLRVGMIVKGPGVPSNKVVSEPVSTMDLSPTLIDYANASPLSEQHGQSLRPLIETDNASRDFALNEWDLLPGRIGLNLTLRLARTKTHKLTLEQQSGAGEMYDLVNDPHEMQNLFDNPDYKSVQQELTDMINARPDDMLPLGTPSGPA
ncbi:sulfatase-like hydrolase/transferase [Amphritea sp.]|uniref:sulfatase-like hydrolase/transferase n=1 Tax=Amphritea sp. TaxID=1872502 RepID=UPI003A90A45D